MELLSARLGDVLSHLYLAMLAPDPAAAMACLLAAARVNQVDDFA